jgi:hypothetical protein
MLVCTSDCTCRVCGRVRLHVVKRVRKHDPKKQTRSTQRRRAIEQTADLGAFIRAIL